MMIPLVYAAIVGAPGVALLLVVILALIPALTIAVELVNWAVTQIIRPESLARMDFSGGIPDECGAMVVIPGMLYELDEVDDLVAQLEQHYLRNPPRGFSLPW